jgi:hypothetical protein
MFLEWHRARAVLNSPPDSVFTKQYEYTKHVDSSPYITGTLRILHAPNTLCLCDEYFHDNTSCWHQTTPFSLLLTRRSIRIQLTQAMIHILL